MARALSKRLFKAPKRQVKVVAIEHLRGGRGREVFYSTEHTAEAEQILSDGRRSLLGGNEPCYVDFAFAAIHGLWLQPREYTAGRNETVRIDHGDAPDAMAREADEWRTRYPQTVEFIEELYRRERLPRADESPSDVTATAA